MKIFFGKPESFFFFKKKKKFHTYMFGDSFFWEAEMFKEN